MNINNLIRKQYLSLFFFLLSIFLLPFNRKLFIISLWPWFFFWIIEGNYRHKINNITLLKGKWGLLFPLMIFFLFLISILWSSNNDHAKMSLIEKLSLVLIPFFIVFSNPENRENQFRLVRKIFIAGLVISSLFLLITATIKAVSINNGSINFDPVVNKWGNVFLYYNFSYLIHPSYYAMMHLMGLAFCLVDMKHKTLFKRPYINIILSVYLIIIVVLSSSRACYIALLLLILFFISSIKTKRYLKIISVLVLIALSAFYINHTTRFKNIMERYEKNTGETRIEALFKTNIRYDLWISSFNIIKDKPLLGSGIGDIQDDLDKEYNNNGIDKASLRSLNAHNQFLESWMAGGIVSLVILLMALIIPLKDKNLIYRELYYYLFIILTTNFLFESMFNRVWGVAFFSIFYSLLTMRYVSNNHKTQH